MMRLLDRLRRHKDTSPPLEAEMALYRQRHRELLYKAMNGRQVYDDLERAARSLADEVQRRPRKA